MKSRQKLNQKTQKGLAAWQHLVLKLPDFTTNSTAPLQENTKWEQTGQRLTDALDKIKRNKVRAIVDGQRYRVGNPNHPHYQLYKEQGLDAVYEEMTEDKQTGNIEKWFNVAFKGAA